VYTFVNGKLRPAETIARMGSGDMENDGGGEFNYTYSTNFCKFHSVPPA
jgi:hypothetical protein